MVAAALWQLQQGADLVKLYVQAANSYDSPWSAAAIRRVADAVHARGAIVTAHAMRLGPARAAVLGGVDAVEHGFRLDADLCAEMARRGTRLVTTLMVPKSWLLIGEQSGGYWATRAGKRVARQTPRARPRTVRDWPARPAFRSAPARTSAAAARGRASSPGKSSRSWRQAWSPGRPLAAATWRGGELLGEPNAGRISEGGPANFFLVGGDPYSDPAALWEVRRLA